MTSTVPGSRMPNPLRFIPELATIAEHLHKAVGTGLIPSATVDLLRLRTGQIIGSEYFTARDTAALREAGESEERIAGVAEWRDADCYSESERVALELVEAVHTPNPGGDRVSDELYSRAAAVYDTRELWTLVTVIGHIGFFTPAALIAKPIPGMPPGRNYSE